MNRKWTGNGQMKREMRRLMRKWTGNQSGNESGNELEMGWKRTGNGPQMKTEMKAGMKAEMDRKRTADGPEMKSGKWKRKWTGNESGNERHFWSKISNSLFPKQE